jgi:hypothetical protein
MRMASPVARGLQQAADDGVPSVRPGMGATTSPGSSPRTASTGAKYEGGRSFAREMPLVTASVGVPGLPGARTRSLAFFWFDRYVVLAEAAARRSQIAPGRRSSS